MESRFHLRFSNFYWCSIYIFPAESFGARFRTWGSTLPCRRRLQSCRRQRSRLRPSSPSREHITIGGGKSVSSLFLPLTGAYDILLQDSRKVAGSSGHIIRLRNKITGIGKGGRNLSIFHFCMCPKPRIHKNLNGTINGHVHFIVSFKIFHALQPIFP